MSVKPRKVGRPTKYHPKRCEEFIELARKGKTLAQIAYAWHVNRDTINEWRAKHEAFSVAVKTGRDFCEAWYMNLGQDAMVGRIVKGKQVTANFGMYCWLTKNMFKWSDRIVEADDEPERPLENLTDEELDEL
jgi:hypothetical protein